MNVPFVFWTDPVCLLHSAFRIHKCGINTVQEADNYCTSNQQHHPGSCIKLGWLESYPSSVMLWHHSSQVVHKSANKPTAMLLTSSDKTCYLLSELRQITVLHEVGLHPLTLGKSFVWIKVDLLRNTGLRTDS